MDLHSWTRKEDTPCAPTARPPPPFETAVHLLADGAHEAGGMVGLAQDCHHLPLHELAAVVAERAMEPLEVQRAEAVAAPHEEAALSQVAAAHCTHTHREGRDLSEFDKQNKATTCGLTGFQTRQCPVGVE